MKFKCGWCGNNFEAEIKKASGAGKHTAGTGHITCPKCRNFIPWRSGK